MVVVGYNPSVENLEKSYLNADFAAGVTTLSVRNTDNFADNDFLLVGAPGSENAEIVQVGAAVSDENDITVGATSFPHSASDPVYVLRYNQIKFYRSTTTIDGSYSNVATVGIDVDNKEGKTLYDDATGLSSYFYKISFYNSESTVESSLSDPIPGSGYARTQVGSVVNDFLTEVGDLQQEYMTVPQIVSLMNEVNDDIIGQSRKPYRFLETSATASLVADSDRVALPTDLWKLDRVKYTSTDVAGSIITKVIPIISIEEMEYNKYRENDIAATLVDDVHELAIDNTTNELVVYPTPTSAGTDVFTIYYYAGMGTFDSLSDSVQTPNPRLYKLFLLGRYYRIRAQKESSFLNLSDRYINDYNTEIVKLQRAQKVDVGSTMSMLPDARTSHGLRR